MQQNLETQLHRQSLEFGACFESLVHLYDICMQRTLSKYGLYPGQPQLMFKLQQLGNPTQNLLADELCVSRASVGVSLRRMEKSGFIKRIRDKQDTRCIRISLTKKGEDYVRWCSMDFEMIFTTMLEDFSGEERDDAIEMAQRICGCLGRLKERTER